MKSKKMVSYLFILLAALVSCTFDNCSNNAGPELPRSSCLDRAIFGNPADSPYILPYPVGAAYEVIQGYCGSGPWSSHNDRFAIDFRMPIGAAVDQALFKFSIKAIWERIANKRKKRR